MKPFKQYTRSVSIFSSLLFTLTFATITNSEAVKNIPVEALPNLLEIQAKNHHEAEVIFHDPILKALPTQTIQHLTHFTYDAVNMLNNQQNLNRALHTACSSYIFKSMLDGLPALDISHFGGDNHYLVFQEIDYIQSQLLKMIENEKKHNGAHAIYFGMNHRYAAYQDLFKELNQIFLCTH
ncbi:MAG: hypothetical protein Q8K37_01185, partial [Alphaproteobacteria bacterium]|nr:hypothetical protein [Alphaproteobacteria bacterium]